MRINSFQPPAWFWRGKWLSDFHETKAMLKPWLRRHWPIFVLIAFNLIVGLMVVKDYGVSADEPHFYTYANQSLNAYRSLMDHQYVPSFESNDLVYYGPALAMVTALVSSLIRVFFPRVFEPDIWHYSYFVEFQITGFFLYCLANRWFARKTCFVLAILFLSQPLLVGHAFINPKDIPFLMAFTVSIVLGLWAADKLPVGKSQNNISYLRLTGSWGQADLRKKYIAAAATVLWFLFVLGLFLGWTVVVSLVDNLVSMMYFGQNPFLASLFHLFVSTSNMQPVDKYISKAVAISLEIRTISIVLFALVVVLLYRPVFPFLFTWLRLGNLKDFLRKSFQFSRSPALFLAGVALGLATSTRIFGPWAGVLVSIYLIVRIRDNASPAIIVYGVIAVITAYATWPFLWPDPVGRFHDSLNVMTTFPWEGKVLFDGAQFSADRLPQVYLPVLLSIQFTESVLTLFVVGLGVMAFRFYQRNISSDQVGLFAGWFLLPVLIIIFTNRPIYDNFRQVLFLIPPIFLVCGLAIEVIFHRFNKDWITLAITMILLIPSAIPLIDLHPYQYVYYNSLVGGVAGASSRFEMDYWATSYAESLRYINQIAPPGSKVLIWTFVHIAGEYARPDLVITARDVQGRDAGHFNYALISSRGDKHLSVFPDAPVIFDVRRDGVIFSVVKNLSP